MATIREILGEAYKDGITFAEVEEATKAMNLADLSGGGYVSIGKYNALAQERDDYKTKYTDTLTEAQKAEQAAAEREKEIQAIKRENSINRYSKKLSSIIKDEDTLAEVAALMADGKFDDAIERQTAYLANHDANLEKQVKEKLMQTNPQAKPQGGGAGEVTAEAFAKMGVAERTKLYNENPELYQKLTEN